MPYQWATLASALPISSSALEASISALRKSIAALDSSINILEGSSRPWETLAIVSSIAVFFGIVGEIIVIVSEYCEDLHDWRMGVYFWVGRVVLPPGRPPRWRFWFDIIATTVVLLGIMGEAWGSLQLASINSQLRSKTSVLRAKSDELLALITLEAGSAVESAEKAQASAENAREDAAKLQLEVMKQGYRSKLLLSHKDELVKKLRPFAGQRFTTLNCFDSNDLEPNLASLDIIQILGLEAKWTNNSGPQGGPYGGQNITNAGIVVRILPNASKTTRDAALALSSALHDALLTGVLFADNGQGVRQILSPTIPFDTQTVLIEVGLHPPH